MKLPRPNRQEIRARLANIPGLKPAAEPGQPDKLTATDIRNELESINQDVTMLLLDEVFLKSRDQTLGEKIKRLKGERQEVRVDLKRVKVELADRQEQVYRYQKLGQAILTDCQNTTAVEAFELADPDQPET